MLYTVSNMTEREIKYVEARVTGKNKIQSAQHATGTTSKAVATVQANRLEKRPAVKNELAKALKKYHINIDRALKPIDKALDATKVVITGKGDDAFAELIPDYTMQMQASDRALRLLGADKPNNDNTSNTAITLSNEQLTALLKNGSIDELQRVIFSKGS